MWRTPLVRLRTDPVDRHERRLRSHFLAVIYAGASVMDSWGHGLLNPFSLAAWNGWKQHAQGKALCSASSPMLPNPKVRDGFVPDRIRKT